jgi:hypothetical protein
MTATVIMSVDLGGFRHSIIYDPDGWDQPLYRYRFETSDDNPGLAVRLGLVNFPTLEEARVLMRADLANTLNACGINDQSLLNILMREYHPDDSFSCSDRSLLDALLFKKAHFEKINP